MNWAATLPLFAVFLVYLEFRIRDLENQLARLDDQPDRPP